MSWLRVHAAVLSGVVLASSAAFVRADCGCAAAAPAPCAAPCAPATRTVTVQEWVPEHYQTTRTVYKQECVQENYTAYRTECVPETQTRQVTVYKSVCETHNEVRTVCRCVPVEETRTVMKQVVTCVPETTYTRRCVDHGHWECRQVECGPSFMERMKKHFHHKNDCCECACECEAPHYRTERVWVSCKVEECVPCTRMVRHVECVPCAVKVCCYKHVAEQVTVPVTCFKCVPQCVTQTCTVMVPHQVAYQACRTVARCVPCQETVTCCRMVCHTVEKQVPCETPCATTCGCENTCGCESECGCGKHKFHLGGMFGGRHHKHETCGCGCN